MISQVHHLGQTWSRVTCGLTQNTLGGCQQRLLRSWHATASREALPGPGGGILSGKGGWFLRYPEVREKRHPKSPTLKEISIYPESRLLVQPKKRGCRDRNRTSSARCAVPGSGVSLTLAPMEDPFFCLSFSHLWAISKLSEQKKKPSSFLSGPLYPLA